MNKIGILAYGSLIQDPGAEIDPLIVHRIPVLTPFPVEFGRWSRIRGDSATLVPHASGIPVTAEILVLHDDVSLEDARDRLWRRETRREGTGEKYGRGNTPNSVLVEALENFGGGEHESFPELSWLLSREAGISMAEIARRLGVSFSCPKRNLS